MATVLAASRSPSRKLPAMQTTVVLCAFHLFHNKQSTWVGATTHLKRSFCAVLTAMERTALDLMEYFKALAVYTFSDEITLLFSPTPENPPPLSGKVSKVVSLAAGTSQNPLPPHARANGSLYQALNAGYASARFNHHIATQEYDPEKERRVRVLYPEHAWLLTLCVYSVNLASAT